MDTACEKNGMGTNDKTDGIEVVIDCAMPLVLEFTERIYVVD